MKQPAPDVIVAGKYCLETQLAAGGMGSVWIAHHLDLNLPVAIKFMDPALASAEGRIRFEREAKAAAYIQSPHVVTVQDYGVDDDLPYIVMELLDGEDLEERLVRVGRLPLEEVLTLITQTARALRRAQELGIVHRDLKPHNIFLARRDEEEIVKILDFGIAKETGPALVAEGTNTGEIIGSPNYMSPEHVRGARDIDFRSDLWSLGVIVFRACTGELPFPGDIVGDVIGKILADPIPRATDIAPDLPPEIDDFFFKALNRDKTQRFQSAREMADAFAGIVRPSLLPAFGPLSERPPPPAGTRGAPNGGGRKSHISIASNGGSDAALSKHALTGSGAPMDARTAAWRKALAGSILLVLVGTTVLVTVLLTGSSGNSTTAATESAPTATPVAAPVAQGLPGGETPAPTASATTPAPSASAAASSAASAEPQVSEPGTPKSGGTWGGPTRGGGSAGTAKPATSSKPPKRTWGF